MVSIIEAQREILLSTIRQITRGDWKVLVLDPDSKRLIYNVLEEDTILNENITNIEQITDRRQTNRDVDAIYILTPQPHIVDCVMADFEKRKYRRAHLVWTSLLHPALRDRIDKSQTARSQIEQFRVLNVEFFPRESHLVTFRDPYSFPVLFHPACNSLVRQHLEDIAQKVVGVCVALGEYPTIRYYRPRTPTHEASILCSHLARFVQDELDLYAKFHEDFPPATNRPRGSLYILDRSLDLSAPLIHEFTYQAMAHDLLPIKEGDKITYRTLINEGQPDEQEKDVEITEKDKLWVENRHRHMKDTIDKLMGDFQRFMKDNPNFTQGGDASSLNTIKDMLAGLPQFQEMKEAYALHLSMAQESMNRFQKYKLPDLASVEQILATGLDEDYKKPKGLADQVVRMLDEESVTPSDRLRLLILFLLYKDGLVPADLQKLLSHAQLPPQDGEVVHNLELLGARTSRNLKDSRPPPPPLFARKPPPAMAMEEYALSRYEPALQNLLEAHAANAVDTTTFPYTKPPLDLGNEPTQQSATSLRSAKPTWAKTRANVSTENRQRVVVMMAGGATYSEARACYNVGRATNREVYLVTSHMLTPGFFIRQIGDLSADKRRLNIPMDMPKPQAPRHLFEPDSQPKAAPQQQQQQAPVQQKPVAPPTQQMGSIDLNGAEKANGQPDKANSRAKLTKDPEKKKKHHFGFGKHKS
ncbi:sec1 family superfamily [Lecanosticta acicola]|uniref:Sec1 family superfamily n=1 Tax=Lecanosticta acicola TaxID=111012 RepID=A0AAI8YU87_9PEZI|nr:sec1 family superfamily [Lecanosticta acicola]